jgi:hypothetical protein
MNQLRQRGRKTPDVPIDAIANSLIVGKWFDKEKFSMLTGILPKSCNPRLRMLVNEGFLEPEGKNGIKFKYRMSSAQKKAMIARAKHNRDKRKTIRYDYSDRITCKANAEVMAHSEHANRLLHSIRFI